MKSTNMVQNTKLQRGICTSIAAFSLLFSIIPSDAATVTMNGNNSSGESSFNSNIDWSPSGAPTAGNVYVNPQYLLRTPNDSTAPNTTFAGDSLTIGNGSSTTAQLVYKGWGNVIITVPDLRLDKGILGNASSNNGTGTFAGNITLLAGGGTIAMTSDTSTTPGRSITITAPISGSAALIITGPAASSTVPVATLSSSANSYSGGTTVNSNARLTATADGALGTGNINILNGGKLTLQSGLTHNYIADGASLWLAAGLTSGSINLSFLGTDTIAGLSFDGGSTFVPAGTYGAIGSGATFTSSVFTGTGMLNVVPEPSPIACMLYGCSVLFLLRRGRSTGARVELVREGKPAID